MTPFCLKSSVAAALLWSLLFVSVLRADDQAKSDAAKSDKAKSAEKASSEDEELSEAEKRFSTLKLPKEATSKALARFVAEVKLHRPRSYAEFVVLQGKIQMAADAILKVEKDKESETYKDAVRDSMEARARLILFLDDKAKKAEYKRFKELLVSVKEPGVDEVRIARSIAISLENGESYAMAIEALGDFDKFFSANDDTVKYATVFRTMLDRVQKRAKLLGTPAEVAGLKLDGSDFDIKSLKGKVVLIDFWATWCGPCIAEFPNLRKLRKKYQAKGFEIVGISLDQNRARLEEFVEAQEMPWIILHAKDTPGKDPVARKYGIEAIPAMFLINREGKLISLNARGQRLTTLLREEFGE